MDFTGERYLPECTGDIYLEHRHRYLLACTYARGKDVLDIACGEGYGSSMLAGVAKSVVGVDIAQEAVTHASKRYPAPHLQFKQGNAAVIPLADASVDLVVSFETIEHHERHEEMMLEIKRVLRPGGVLLISSPDKHEYTDVPGVQNEFHVRELYKNEFEALLDAHFAHHKIAGQRVVYASVLASNNPNEVFLSWENETATAGLSRPLYFIALASDGSLPDLPHSVMQLPVAESDYAKQLHDHILQLDEHSAELTEHNTQLDKHAIQLTALVATLQEQRAEQDEQNVALQERNTVLQKHNETLQEEALLTQQQLATVQAELRAVYASRSWRLTGPFRKVVHALSNKPRS